MTRLANTRGVNVTRRQAMASGTGAGAIHLRVIYCQHWRPSRTGVTGLTNIGGIDVATRQAVTRCTSTIHLCVVYRSRRHPSVSVMARFTNITGINVRGRLTCGCNIIMTTNAIISDAGMVKTNNGGPIRSDMASITFFGGGNM